jgi:excisionase family DNA binding protein
VGQLAERLLEVASELPTEDIPDFIGRLETAKATLWARLTSPRPASQDHDELLGVAEAARRLGVSEDYLYSHHQEYAFTRRQGRKLLFSASRIDRYIKQK